MQKGKTLILNGEKYFTEEILGEGSYGIVLKARKETNNEIYAIKFIKESGKDEFKLDDEFITEKVILQVLKEKTGKCKKDFICYEDAFKETGKNGNEYVFITKFIEGMNLYDFLEAKMLRKHDAKIIFKNLIKGYKKLLRRGVIHRDIKPENIMIDPKTLEITYIDFGLSCLSSPSIHRGLIDNTYVTNVGMNSKLSLGPSNFQCTGIKGSPVYIAPEVIQYQFATEKSDIYALGITFLFILTGKDEILKQYYSDPVDYLRTIREDAFGNVNLFSGSSSSGSSSSVSGNSQITRGQGRIDLIDLITHVKNIYHIEMAQLLEAMTDRDPDQRPKPDWILHKIDECFKY